MGHYRLIADHGRPAVEFDAPDDGRAELRGRDLSEGIDTARGVGYRLERLEGAVWVAVIAWVPFRVHDHPVPVNEIVPASRPFPAPDRLR